MTGRPHIDPPDGEPRCVHDMLHGQCSWCLGLPDLPAEADPETENIDEHVSVRWLPLERASTCAGCGRDLRAGEQAAWSGQNAGNVGLCCAESVA